MKNYLPLLSLFLLLLLPNLSQAQFTVTINDKYVDGAPVSGSTLSIGTSSFIYVNFVAQVVAQTAPTSAGTINAYYKTTSGSTPVLIGNGGSLPFGGQTTATKDFTFTLSAADFNPTGGVVYVEFKNAAGTAFKSANLNVTKQPSPAITGNSVTPASQTIYYGQTPAALLGSNPGGGNNTYTYKWEQKTTGQWSVISGATLKNYTVPALTTTTQFRRVVSSGSASPSTSAVVTVTVNNSPAVASNTITQSQTINEGQTPSALNGSLPTGGNGANSYTYSWESKVGSAAWVAISGATGQNYAPGTLLASTQYRRKITSGNAPVSESNIITINVIAAPQLLNNNITYSNGAFTGSMPTGGTGTYTYTWVVDNVNAEYIEYTENNGVTFVPSHAAYLMNQTHQNTLVRRIVKSGGQTLGSNVITIPLTTAPVTNNTFALTDIDFSTNPPAWTFTGSTPSGGTGFYTYSWVLIYEVPVFAGTQKDFVADTNTVNNITNYSGEVYLMRIVRSGGLQLNSAMLKLK